MTELAAPPMEASPAPARFTPYALAIFVLALALRALHLWQLRASPFLTAKLGDAAGYDKWARAIAGGDWLGHEVFFQAPLYPYFLGVVYATLGDEPLLVRGLQAVLSALACALLASAAASLFSRGAGLAAGLLLATYAPSIFLDGLLQKSVLDVFFICLVLWLAARLVHSPRQGLAAALGLAIGLLTLARENAVILAGVLAAWLLVLPGVARPRRWVLAGVFAVGLAGALLPVALRNWWVGREFHLTTSQLGLNLYLGNHPGATGLYQPLEGSRGVESERQDTIALAEQAVGRTLSPGEVSAYWTGRALDYIVSQPADWLRLMLRKLLLLVSTLELVDAEDQYVTADYSFVLRAAGRLGHFGVLLPLAVLGAFVTWRQRRTLWWIHAALAAYAASVLLFYVVARYRYPLVPLLALLAGAGLAGTWEWVRARSRAEVAACAALVLVLAALSNGVSGMAKASMGAVTYSNLGNSARLAGQLELAAQHYRKALALDPELEDAADNLAGTLRALGRPVEELDAYERMLAERPRDPRLHRKLAGLLRAKGEPKRALEHLQRSLELEPSNADTRLDLAELHVEIASQEVRQGDSAAALAHYRSALALEPDTPAALWGAAWILATQRDSALRRPAEALALAERAAARSGQLSPPMLEALAAAYAAEGRFEEAIERARQALALHAAAGRPPPRRLTLSLSHYERGEPLWLPEPGQ